MSMQRATVVEKISNMGPMSGGASPTAGKGATICLHLKDVELMWIGHTRERSGTGKMESRARLRYHGEVMME